MKPLPICARAALPFFFAWAACAAGAVGTEGPTARVAIDPSAQGTALPPELFGINSTWQDAGGGIVEFGEMIRDRSFRNQDSAAARAWIESPNADTGGRIRHEAKGGDDHPWGGQGYPGYMVLSQKSPGYTCISQQTADGTTQGARYEMHVSARSESADMAIAAFFADKGFLPIEKADRFVAVHPGAWSDYRLVLEPGRTDAFGMVRVCLVSAGTVALDEVRLRQMDASPGVKAQPASRIRMLGPRSLRWPAGSDADYFDWTQSVGPVQARGEVANAFGVFQTPAWGLHEFLDFCEAQDMVPLITVNLRRPPADAARLVEYILGDAKTPMGALRARNGRAQPWKVRHFELGNEPAQYYQGQHDAADTAQGYVDLALPVANAMRSEAAALGRPLELKGAVETTFASADWLKAVPMLARWNEIVLDRKRGLVRQVDQLHGHFYSAFTYRGSEREQFDEVMAGGATLAASVRALQRRFGPLPPFWLTEYSVLVEKKARFFGSNQILLERSKDFEAGLAAADLLLTAIREGYGGAYLFNLSEFGTWGVLANYRDFRLRPAGYAFAMLSPLAGAARVPATVAGGHAVTVKGGDGNNPANARFDTLSAVAARSGAGLRVVILNRSWETNEKVWIDTGTVARRKAHIERLGPAAPTASNDERADTVRPVASDTTVEGAHVVEVPARSLVSVFYPVP